MSLLDKYAQLYADNATRRNPYRNMTRKLMDPDYLTPDDFYMMDEIGQRQVLRKFNKASGQPVYIGTYQVLYKTTDMDKFCLIMRRIGDEWPVPREFFEQSEAERGHFIVAEYYPGTHSRIYLKGLGEAAVARIVERFERKTRKKLGPGVKR